MRLPLPIELNSLPQCKQVRRATGPPPDAPVLWIPLQ